MAILHSLYRCCLVRRTPCACGPAVYASVLIVVVRDCIVVSISGLCPLLGVGGLSVHCCFLGAQWPNLPHMWAGLETFFLACAEFWKLLDLLYYYLIIIIPCNAYLFSLSSIVFSLITLFHVYSHVKNS